MFLPDSHAGEIVKKQESIRHMVGCYYFLEDEKFGCLLIPISLELDKDTKVAKECSGSAYWASELHSDMRPLVAHSMRKYRK
jgi:hypothetical protein